MNAALWQLRLFGAHTHLLLEKVQDHVIASSLVDVPTKKQRERERDPRKQSRFFCTRILVQNQKKGTRLLFPEEKRAFSPRPAVYALTVFAPRPTAMLHKFLGLSRPNNCLLCLSALFSFVFFYS